LELEKLGGHCTEGGTWVEGGPQDELGCGGPRGNAKPERTWDVVRGGGAWRGRTILGGGGRDVRGAERGASVDATCPAIAPLAQRPHQATWAQRGRLGRSRFGRMTSAESPTSEAATTRARGGVGAVAVCPGSGPPRFLVHEAPEGECAILEKARLSLSDGGIAQGAWRALGLEGGHSVTGAQFVHAGRGGTRAGRRLVRELSRAWWVPKRSAVQVIEGGCRGVSVLAPPGWCPTDGARCHGVVCSDIRKIRHSHAHQSDSGSRVGRASGLVVD